MSQAGAWLLVCLLTAAWPIKQGHADSPISSEADFWSDEETIFALGNVLFAAYHEFGHALIDLLDLPVVGREEDAADGFAAVKMIPETADPLADRLLVAAADGWWLQSERADALPNLPLWGAHALDPQRYFRLVCLMVGSDPDGFAGYARDAGLPPVKVAGCGRDYQALTSGWARLLAPHRKVGNAGSGRISLIMAPPADQRLQLDRLLQSGGVVKEAVAVLDGRFDLPESVTLRFDNCPDANGYWAPATREIVLCYDLIVAFLDLLAMDPR
jgi:hypothetical protein